MKIEVKLGISTGILVSAMLLSAVTAHIRVAKASRLSSAVTTRQVPLTDAMQELASDLSLSVRALESAMFFGIEPDTAKFFIQQRARRIASADEAIARIREHLVLEELDPTQRNRFGRIEDNMTRLKQLESRVESLNNLHTQEGIAQAYDLTRTEIMPIDAALEQQIRTLITAQQVITEAQMSGLGQANRSIVLTLWTGVFLSVLIGGCISAFFTRRIANSVRLVADRANLIAAGDLTGKALAIDSKDEIGDLALAMQTMQTNLATVIGTAIETTRSLTGSADSMHSASDLIHQRIDAQSQQTQQAATALQEMSASIAEVSRHAQSAADTARSAAQTAHEGGDVVKQMLGSMSSIATAVHETSATVGLLGEDSKRISQIVTVIDEIARKTNLLALNAAIEAARAGEQGRGFAVVAGEVRRLAESTAQATSQIAAMIRGIQDRTHVAIASLANGTATVEQGVGTTNLAGEALERIIGMAERVDRMIAQIAIAATQQSVAANESSASLHSIYSLSHENLCEMATTTAGIESLRATAIALEQHVIHFSLEEVASTTIPTKAQPRTTPQSSQIFQPA